MQEVKSKKIEAAIDDPKIFDKLTLEELLKLFGPVHHDGNGMPFIFTDVQPGSPLPRSPHGIAGTSRSDQNATIGSEDPE